MNPLVYLDAGHGPAKPKAYAPGVDEQAVAWILCEMLRDAMSREPVVVIPTRASYFDTPTLAQRVNDANRAEADLFVSVHLNAARGKVRNRIEVIHHPSRGGQIAGQAMTAALEAGHPKIGVKRIVSPSPDYPPALYVLKRTRMPAVLIECGYIHQDAGAALFRSPDYPDMLIRGMRDGIFRALQALGVIKKTGG